MNSKKLFAKIVKEDLKTRKLLLISYYFPPIPAPEAYMTSNYVKHLSTFGWDPIVICGKQFSAGSLDYSDLNKDLSNIRVYRINALENILINLFRKTKTPQDSLLMPNISKNAENYRLLFKKRIYNLLKFINILPFHVKGWVPFAVIIGAKILITEDIKLIITRSSPISSHITGLILNYFFKCPWVVCFSDPWTTLDIFYKDKIIHGKYLQKFDEYLEKKIIFRADKIILTTDLQREDYIKRFTHINKDKFIVIPNSFDTDMIVGKNCERIKNDNLIITHVGSFSKINPPIALFKALVLIRDENKDIYKHIKIKLLGSTESYKDLLQEYDLTEVIDVINRVPHKDVLTYLYNSNILLLVLYDIHFKNIATKLVEYIFVGTPILAIAPLGGSSAKVVQKTKTGIVVSPEDIKKIKETIETFYSDYIGGNLGISPDWDEINKYSAENCTKTLVKTIELLIDQHEKESRHENK